MPRSIRTADHVNPIHNSPVAVRARPGRSLAPQPGDTVPETGLRPRRHHQHHEPGAPGQLERRETPVSVRSNALNVRFHGVRQRPAVSTSHRKPASTHRYPTTVAGSLARIAECPGKYDCPVSVIGLPSIHDLSPGAEAARIHESGTAAFGCPGRRSGCLVSASRHVPAAAPGRNPSGAVSFTSGRIDRPKSLSCRLDN
jgi:hypothetical protein